MTYLHCVYEICRRDIQGVLAVAVGDLWECISQSQALQAGLVFRTDGHIPDSNILVKESERKE